MPRLSTDRTLPKAITQLRLSFSLRDCGANRVEDVFDKSDADCIYAYDDQGLGYSDWCITKPEFSSKSFRINNKNKTTICLLPLDGRIITGPRIIMGGVCDCLLLTENEMTFVEFKTNVTTQNPQSALNKADEAIEQILHTFNDIFLPRCGTLIAQNQLNINFYVVFDEDYNVTGVNSSIMDLSVEFFNNNKYPLYFDNKKDY